MDWSEMEINYREEGFKAAKGIILGALLSAAMWAALLILGLCL